MIEEVHPLERSAVGLSPLLKEQLAASESIGNERKQPAAVANVGDVTDDLTGGDGDDDR